MKRLMYWAVIGYSRWWHWFDGAESTTLKATKKLDGRAVRRIGYAYQVSRGVLGRKKDPDTGKRIGDKKEDSHARDLALIIETRRKEWTANADILKRARICTEVAGAALKGKHTRVVQVSAVTKLFWFVGPAGWTVFDKFAAKGLGIRTVGATDRADAFYQALATSSFASDSVKGNSLIKAAGMAFPMERVFDQQLWLAGLPDTRREEELRTYEGYLATLPPAWRENLEMLADEIDRAIPIIPPVPRPPRKRRATAAASRSGERP